MDLVGKSGADKPAINCNKKLSVWQRKKLERSRELARLYFIEGLTQEKAIRKVFPRYSKDGADKHGPEIMRRYDVVNTYLSMFPDTTDPKECDQLLGIAKTIALKKNDVNIMLAISDRIAKLHGRYSDKITLGRELPEEEAMRSVRAKKLLERNGIDPSKLNWNR